MKALPVAALVSALIATGAFVGPRHRNSVTPVDWSSAQRVEIRMIEYEFVPNQLRFRRGQPYQLHLVNSGKEGHDFAAPDFFTSVQLRDTGAPNTIGTPVFVQPGQIAEIYFIAYKAGLFPLRCADHDWAGMTATIIVD